MPFLAQLGAEDDSTFLTIALLCIFLILVAISITVFVIHDYVNKMRQHHNRFNDHWPDNDQ